MTENTKKWIRPDQFMKIQRKKLLKLRERLEQDPEPTKEQSPVSNKFSSEKRSNPFARNSDHDLKRVRTRYTPIKSDTFFDRIHNKDSKAAANLEAPLNSPRKFARSLFAEDEEDQASDTEPSKPTENLPWDWSLKSRVRILSKTPIVNSTLKSVQEASGLTGFVRCIDITSTDTGLDNSEESKFHQNTMYWQYPHLPWLNLVQRNASANNQFKMNAPESELLLKDWMDCFKNLFQLLKASQCAFFYVLGNQFTVLFRAAGIGGIGEMHAFLTPTTRGFRQMLKEEAIEYTQPLKKSSKEGATPNTSLEHQNESKNLDEDEDEEDELKFLESLGVQTSDIKFKEDIIAKQKEIEDDNGDLSTALIEGVDCQAFFNFLLNAKSTVPKVGRLAGIPPTLLSPVAFLGSSLRRQTSRASKIRLENEDFYSIELRGAILPNTVHSICGFLSGMKDSYSLTMSNYVHTIAFTKASRKVIEDLTTLRETGERAAVEDVKLTDCGMSSDIIESLRRLDETAVNIVERFQYNKQNGGFTLF